MSQEEGRMSGRLETEEIMPSEAEIDAAAKAIMKSMFAPHEPPRGDIPLLVAYRDTARAALEAAEKVRQHRPADWAVDWPASPAESDKGGNAE